jgi:transposase
MTAEETMKAVSKRDCVEKTFRALKGWMGMDKIGVQSENSMHAKILIWFVASIIRSLIFTKTEKAREKDKKRYTLPAIIDQLEEIRADKDLSKGKYQRRYRPTKIQNNCLRMLGVTLDSVDEIIEGIG